METLCSNFLSEFTEYPHLLRVILEVAKRERERERDRMCIYVYVVVGRRSNTQCADPLLVQLVVSHSTSSRGIFTSSPDPPG
jgi:hypothetical protein